MIYQCEPFFIENLPVKVCPKISSFGGVKGLGDLVLSMATTDAFRSATGALAAEYWRGNTAGKHPIPCNAGTRPNRDGWSGEKARLSIVNPAKFHQFFL